MLRSYESDITRFLRELKEKNPEIARGQRQGRAIFWDKDIDADLYRRYEASAVPQAAYAYARRCRETARSNTQAQLNSISPSCSIWRRRHARGRGRKLNA